MRATDAPPTDARAGWLGVAGLASIGAGAIHASAIGAHGEQRQQAWTFALVAAFQIAIGVVALVRPGRIVGFVLGIGSAAAIGGWVLAKTSGIPFLVDFPGSDSVQTADLLAAGLAAVALAASVAALFRITVATRSTTIMYAACGIVVALIAVPAMVSVSSHGHGDGGHGDDHGDGGHGEVAVVPPEPFDGTLPVNLSGIDGVTPEQQLAAEELVERTILVLPTHEPVETLPDRGWHSIGDEGTGHEHFINWSYINDDKILDPEYPESLVVQKVDGVKKIVAAMYMLPQDTPLTDVPEVGGKLTQWHVHDDLCFTEDPVAPRVAGLRAIKGECRAPLVARGNTPMIHVWIIPHPCGPFAALDGIGGGQVAEGEEHFCNQVHGHGEGDGDDIPSF